MGRWKECYETTEVSAPGISCRFLQVGYIPREVQARQPSLKEGFLACIDGDLRRDHKSLIVMATSSTYASEGVDFQSTIELRVEVREQTELSDFLQPTSEHSQRF